MIRDNVKKLLQKFPHRNSWLLDQWHPDLETQVNVEPGTPEEAHPSKKDCWTNGVHMWKHIRWPYNHNSKPNFTDFVPEFPFVDEDGTFPYLRSVGTTWWNWVLLESEAVVFDFDSIVKHPIKGLSERDLKEVLNKILTLDYATAYKSTSSEGFHVHVGFQEGFRPQTANSNEHALVAQVVLQKMSEDAGFDLADKVDCYGMIGWIWATRAIGTEGFAMVKQAGSDLKADEIDDWTKIPAQRMRRRPRIIAYDEDGGEIEGNNILGLQDKVVVIDSDHKQILSALEGKDFNFNYVQEHNLFHTHTTALKQVHKELGLKGPFETSTSGSNLCNCFIRPIDGGGFAVFRFGQGTVEHQLWDHSGKTTWCTYNQAIPPHKVVLKMGGEWYGETKHYEFEDHIDLMRCAQILGNKVPLKLIDNRHYGLQINGRGMVIKCLCDKDETPAECDGWDRVSGYFKKVLSRLEELDEDSILSEVDNLVRFIKRKRQPVSWVKHDPDGWSYTSNSEAKRFVAYKVGSKNAELYMGMANANPWQQVCEPFMPEDLDSRRWNADSARLVAQCASKTGPHLNWDMILAHIGQSLDEPLEDNIEMHKYGIYTGADYLKAWIACLIRYPKSPLPYLFFVGPENSGKSSVHEALRKCIEEGVVHGGTAMVSASGFNGEFSGKVLAAIDETDLSKSEGLSAKIKFWTNATTIPIHIKGQQPFDAENTMHFMQSGNSVEVCVIPYGDTRMMAFWVPGFEGIEVPKEVLMDRCVEELPNFLYTLGTLQLPPLTGRTRIPVISTEIKSEIMQSTEPTSIEFINVMYHEVPGHSVKLSDAYDAYKKWCISETKKPVAPNDFKLQLGIKYPVHKGPRGRAISIGNLSINVNAAPKDPFTMEGKDGRHERVSTDSV